MPILFAEEKKAWREQFLGYLSEALNNPETLVEALLLRQNIKKKEGGLSKHCSSEDFSAAFKALDDKDASIYEGDIARAEGVLQTIGFSSEEIRSMPASSKIKIDAAIGYAKARLCYEFNEKREIIRLSEFELAYQDLELDPEESIEDKRDFIDKQLPKEAKPMVRSYLPPSNKTSLLTKIFGGLLIALGIVLAVAPIPVVTQAIGGAMVAMGVGLFTAMLGAGVFAVGNRMEKISKETTLSHPTSSSIITKGQEAPDGPSSSARAIQGLGGSGATENREPEETFTGSLFADDSDVNEAAELLPKDSKAPGLH
ncbi:hypothetical protein [Legionella impletisoli]|uniref:Uncharacterized protein n=1 Tax=Legionella impletisoli TaxID=343510 RepID=A0A917NAU4_9GAMM|nr:hypothetical protein [Legionella impletisoli]GGI78965.1 hypothetical protein GCM10007966_04360 [Legionella impletisoli]